MTKSYSVGIDIGSTTAKIVVLCNNTIVFKKYERHFSQVRKKALELISEAKDYLSRIDFTVAISGSAGIGLAEASGIPFVQEVFATREVIKKIEPDASAVIELGGEDAKIIFYDGTPDERMNGSCAGGTGAFIDQMATLLAVTPDELDELSQHSERLYTIASRCGVFAKTDIQALLNQGAGKADIAASIYRSVVNQTIAGLAQGRKITGKVVFLGGPLYYCKGLRTSFKEALNLDDENVVFPDYALYSVALGAALYSQSCGKQYTYSSLVSSITENIDTVESADRLEGLFTDKDEYFAFIQRHSKATVSFIDISTYSGNAYLGIDCGSTTTKLVLINDNFDIIYQYYGPNKGNPIEIIKEQLIKIYDLASNRIHIKGSTVVGYGEELIKNAFGVDKGIVETLAHYKAAKHFQPEVDFIIDIGGQDMKCFKIKNGAIDGIMLNEACSSGCGSFIETFAHSMGYTAAEFAEKGLHSTAPVNLGSRCTVFMNSSVKQSQKDGATVEDISAGLAISVVKNAIYKVIRASSPEDLGKHIVVQGGTFKSDTVLRAFEKELVREVVRPQIAELMGAYGAALHAMHIKETTLISSEALKDFSHTVSSAQCQLCTNNCRLTINKFPDGRSFISGNQCEKGLGKAKSNSSGINLFEFKRQYLQNIPSVKGSRGRIGLPLALGIYELLPLWHGIFTDLGYEVVLSGMSTRKIYEAGQFTIPSDTICYPAKIMHGHVEILIKKGVDAIFYPCLTYNFAEKDTDNHYNCPIVAYYSELLNANMDDLRYTKFLYPFLNINNKKVLAKGLFDSLSAISPDITLKQIRSAINNGYSKYHEYMDEVKKQGELALAKARADNRRVMILAGRPYHIDLEIGHGIDKLADSLGFAVISEDSIYHLAQKQPVNVLNQWTYHSRLYKAARFAADNPDVELVQLVSFGCGVDAITSDEVSDILTDSGKLYTQIKIDEITNLGAVKIRLRSLLGVLEERGEAANA
ncbi:MAG: acyl-CoA dehydratase activase [Eubacteriales bacterium]|nr:acyl-CoA dehydratase activase [Eubacteriales bacterium]